MQGRGRGRGCTHGMKARVLSREVMERDKRGRARASTMMREGKGRRGSAFQILVILWFKVGLGWKRLFSTHPEFNYNLLNPLALGCSTPVCRWNYAYSLVQKKCPLFEFLFFPLPTNLKKLINSQSALTELPSPNIAPFLLLDPVHAFVFNFPTC